MVGGCGCAGNKLEPDLLHTSRQSYWSLERSDVEFKNLWNLSRCLIEFKSVLIISINLQHSF